MNRLYYVYIMTNLTNSVLYIGVTNDLEKRVWEHKMKIIKGFTKKYNVSKLVYFEEYNDIEEAIAREKQLKKGPRARKEKLIFTMNPGWRDLLLS